MELISNQAVLVNPYYNFPFGDLEHCGLHNRRHNLFCSLREAFWGAMYTSTSIPRPLLCQSSFLHSLPSSSLEVSASTFIPQRLPRHEPLGNSSSPFFSPSWVWEISPSPARVRVALVRALGYEDKKEDDKFRWRGREQFRDGDKNGGGIGRGAAPRG